MLRKMFEKKSLAIDYCKFNLMYYSNDAIKFINHFLFVSLKVFDIILQSSTLGSHNISACGTLSKL